jgi:hypothetical protein
MSLDFSPHSIRFETKIVPKKPGLSPLKEWHERPGRVIAICNPRVGGELVGGAVQASDNSRKTTLLGTGRPPLKAPLKATWQCGRRFAN